MTAYAAIQNPTVCYNIFHDSWNYYQHLLNTPPLFTKFTLRPQSAQAAHPRCSRRPHSVATTSSFLCKRQTAALSLCMFKMIATAWRSRRCHTAHTLRVHSAHTARTQRAHCSYTARTLLVHCAYTLFIWALKNVVVTPLLFDRALNGE